MNEPNLAHGPVCGYLPRLWSVAQWEDRQQSDPERVTRESSQSMARHVDLMQDIKDRGVIIMEYSNNLRTITLDCGVENAFDFPGSLRSVSDRYFVAERGLSVGWHYQQIRKAFIERAPKFVN
ncbi:MAG: hypothetical protein GY761_13030 [Hyphomicrobiales bacterium]|nr:hypothetical protein [Hyphomicrobiales bacterium]